MLEKGTQDFSISQEYSGQKNIFTGKHLHYFLKTKPPPVTKKDKRTMNRVQTTGIVILLALLSGGAVTVFLTGGSAPSGSEEAETATTVASEKTHELTGTWKLVEASITPDFLKVPVPVTTFEATGSVSPDSTYAINANGSFFGRNYGYAGNGDIDIQGQNITLTIGEGIITYGKDGKKRDRKGKTISGTYVRNSLDTLFVEAVKYQEGIGYTFNLTLVNP